MSIFRDEYDYLKIGPIVVTAILVFFMLIFLFTTVGYFGTKSSCDKYNQTIGYQTKFVDNYPFYWSCQVNLPSGWIDYDSINNINLSTKGE